MFDAKRKLIMFCKSYNGLIYFESMKICAIYLLVGLLWIYTSDSIVNFLIIHYKFSLKLATYKGFLFIFVTTILLFSLISKLGRRIKDSEKKLLNLREELQAYTEQLVAYEEELTAQNKQILENESQLVKINEKNRAIIDAIPDVLFILDYNGVFLNCETSDESLLFLPREAFIGKSIAEVMPNEISELAYKHLKLLLATGNLQTFDYKLIKDEEEGFFELRMVKKGKNQVLAILRNITITKRLEQSLEYLSYNDQLTGLYNRRYFEEKLKDIDVPENLPLTVAMADINGLKLINDCFGHIMGDELIQKSANGIKNGCRSQDTIIRLGGDEFLILLPKTDNIKAKEIINKINNLCQTEKVENINISISLGYETKYLESELIHDIFNKAEDYMYKQKTSRSSLVRKEAIDAIITTLNSKNNREEQHSFQVSKLCKLMGEKLGLTERKIEKLQTAALLHDIGKIAINENILDKPSSLSEHEYNEIKRHSEVGYRILNTLSEMSEIAEYVLLHHEKWNGDGYPKKLKGPEIPIESRIISIIDTYDAMTSDRPYRKALSKDIAIKELERNSGIQFDPELVDLFIKDVIN